VKLETTDGGSYTDYCLLFTVYCLLITDSSIILIASLKISFYFSSTLAG